MDVVTDIPPAAAAVRLAYDGRLGDLYRIFWRNLLLSVLTLGIFRFWAVTRNRRYLWAHTSFLGDRFEYTGTGGEKLRGFLVAMAFLAVLAGLNTAIGFVGLPSRSPARAALVLLYPAAILMLGQMAPFTAQRYRLSRTQWRGLGGGMTGSAAGYGVTALLYTIATATSALLLTPLQRMRLIERRIDASSFADARMEFVREPGLAYPAFLGSVVLKVVLLAAVSGAGAALAYALHAAGPGAATNPHTVARVHWSVIPVALAIVFLVPPLNRLCNSWYDDAVLRRVLERTRYLDLRFATRISGARLFALRLQNAAIMLFTLGLGSPIVRQRCARFATDCVEITGAFDPSKLRRDSEPRPKRGEGLFEAFDVGFLY